MKHIAVLTSGGDAPGMNAAVRSVVRTAAFNNLKVSGISRGYQGLIDGNIKELGPRDVANIIQRGGTVLRSARCQYFRQVEGRAEGAKTLKQHNVDGLVVIGGDGSFQGAHLLCNEQGIPVVGIPATIDNDISGTDVSIGFDTALNVALEAMDRLRDTAASHDRLFLVEVMGRDSGYIALHAGLAAGAEIILIPEVSFKLEDITKSLSDFAKRGKSSSIIVVAEGAYESGAIALAKDLEGISSDYEIRTTILGHIQRGGAPSARDRVLASRFGYSAVQALKEGKSDVMIAKSKNDMAIVPLDQFQKAHKNVDLQLYEISKVLAT